MPSSSPRSVEALLSLALLMMLPSPVSAQTRRAATAFDLSSRRPPALGAALDSVLREAGFTVLDSGSVRAARALGGYTSLAPQAASALRAALSVELLVVVRTLPAEDPGTLHVAVHRVTEGEERGAFEQATIESLPLVAAALLRRGLEASVSTGSPSAAPATADAASPASSAEADLGSRPPVAAPAAASPAASTAPPTPSAERPVVPSPATSPVADPVATLPSRAHPDAPPARSNSRGAHDVSEPERPASAMRTRLDIVGAAGFDAYGYGLTVRVEIPLARLLPRDDNALVLGLEVGATLNGAQVDPQHSFLYVGVPAAVTLGWWFAIGESFELGPRAGIAGLTRVSLLEGDVARGTLVSLALVGLVGAQALIRLSPSIGLMIGADLAIGPQIAPVLSLGVSL